MIILFDNKKLLELANNSRKAQAELGQLRSKLFRRRLDDIAAVDNMNDLKHLPGHFHELTGDRRGQWACSLDNPYRLVFVSSLRPVPIDEKGNYLWNEMQSVTILEIVDYHL